MSWIRTTRAHRIAAAAVAVAAGVAAVAAGLAAAKPPAKAHLLRKLSGGPSAYAYVIPGEVSLNVGPVLVQSRTLNVVGVTEPAFGVYCLRTAQSVDASSRAWTASPEATRSSAVSHAMFAYIDVATCPAGQIGVRTFESTGTGAATPSEHVAFMLVSG